MTGEEPKSVDTVLFFMRLNLDTGEVISNSNHNQ